MADNNTISQLSQWLYNVGGNYIYPKQSTTNLRIPAQANTGGCAYFDASGNLLGGTTCSGGGGGSASTTINGLKPSTGTFQFNGSTTADTNITLSVSTTSPGTINLTGGFTGTLAAARLNSNVVQGVTNDTNVTGSIAAQNLTLGWTGTLADSRIASAANWNGIYNNVLSRLVVATGTSGTIFNIATTTNSLTINLPTASASNTGQLQAADWTTFNSKVSNTYASSSYFTLWNTVAGSNTTITTTTNPTIAVVASPSFTNGTFSGTLTTSGGSAVTFGVLATSFPGCVQSTSGGVISNVNALCIIGGGASSQIPYFTGGQTQSGTNNFEWLNTSNTLAITGSTTISNLLTVGATLKVSATSTLATTTINGVDIVGQFDKSFQLASTTLDTFNLSFSSATTTFQLWNPSYPVKLTKLYCKTDTGTVLLNISGNLVNCTSTGASSTPSTLFGVEADINASLGSAASTPNRVRVTTSWVAQ